MTLIDAQELPFEEESPRRSGRGRRIVVAMVGLLLAAAACAIMGLAFVQGSWWYLYPTDVALDHESRSRAEAIRDEVDASGAAPEAAKLSTAALDPGADPTTVRMCILSAQEILGAADDPELLEAAKELAEIVYAMRRVRPFRATSTPRPMPTLEWPYGD